MVVDDGREQWMFQLDLINQKGRPLAASHLRGTKLPCAGKQKSHYWDKTNQRHT